MKTRALITNPTAPRILAIPILALLAIGGRESARAADGGEPLTVQMFVFKDAPMTLVVSRFEAETGERLVVKGTPLQAKITLMLNDKTALEIVETMANTNGWIWWQPEDGLYELMDKDMYEKTVLINQVQRKTFRPKYRTAQEIADALEGLVTPNIGHIAIDPTTNKVMVTDLIDRIGMMLSVIDEIDIPLYTHFFTIRHADVAEIEIHLSTLVSEVGTIQVDERTHQIIVRDLLENIKQMEQFVAALDIGPEMKVYEITNIGKDGEALEQLVDAITEIVTDESAVTYNIDQGRIFIEDIPEVHERVARLIEIFDQPPKQVYLQAEIVEVALTKDFTFSANLTLLGSNSTLFDSGGDTVDANGDPVATTAMNFVNLETIRPIFNLSSSGISFGDIGEHFSLQLSSMLSDSDTKVLLKPRLIVKNNEEAELSVSVNLPIVNTFFNNNFNNNQGNLNQGFQSSSQSSIRTGIILGFIPSISNNGLIELEVDIENSTGRRLPQEETGNVPGGLVETTEQRAFTTMIIPSGETRVLGGFITRKEVKNFSGVPGLRSIPLIGPFFGTRTTNFEDRTVLFFITPIIIEEEPRVNFLAAERKKYYDYSAQPLAAAWQQPAATDYDQQRSALPWEYDNSSSPTLERRPFTNLTLAPAPSDPSGLMPAVPGIQGMDETGPFANFRSGPISSISRGGAAPPVTLSDEVPPTILSGTVMDRAFGDREIPRFATNYRLNMAGPSGRITPAERSALGREQPGTAPGAARPSVPTAPGAAVARPGQTPRALRITPPAAPGGQSPDVEFPGAGGAPTPPPPSSRIPLPPPPQLTISPPPPPTPQP